MSDLKPPSEKMASPIDYGEALRLIRKHMQPGDTLGMMFMRVARELEEQNPKDCEAGEVCDGCGRLLICRHCGKFRSAGAGAKPQSEEREESLLNALKPFAKQLEYWRDGEDLPEYTPPDKCLAAIRPRTWNHPSGAMLGDESVTAFSYGDLRRARDLIAGAGAKPPSEETDIDQIALNAALAIEQLNWGHPTQRTAGIQKVIADALRAVGASVGKP